MSEEESDLHARANSATALGSRREQILRYLLKHPEYDQPETNGELTFFMARQASTGKSVVTVRFHANPEIFA